MMHGNGVHEEVDATVGSSRFVYLHTFDATISILGFLASP